MSETPEVTIGKLIEKPSANLLEFQDFVESRVWRDFKESIEGKMALNRIALEIAKEPMDMYFLQGQILELKFLLDLPDLIIEHLKVIKEEEKEEEKEDE